MRRIWAGCKWYRNTLPVRFQTLQYSRGLPVLPIMLGMREPEMRLGCTRNRLLNRISDRLRESAMKVHRRDLKLLAYGEMLTSLKEDLRQQREEWRAEALEPAAA